MVIVRYGMVCIKVITSDDGVYFADIENLDTMIPRADDCRGLCSQRAGTRLEG